MVQCLNNNNDIIMTEQMFERYVNVIGNRNKLRLSLKQSYVIKMT